jgi:hypothetical protein
MAPIKSCFGNTLLISSIAFFVKFIGLNKIVVEPDLFVKFIHAIQENSYVLSLPPADLWSLRN